MVVTRNAEDPASVGVQQPGIPKHRVSAGLDWTGPRGVVLSPRLRWLGATSGDPDAIYRTQQHLVVDLGGRVPLAALTGFIETLQGPARDDPAARERFLGIMRDQA